MWRCVFNEGVVDRIFVHSLIGFAHVRCLLAVGCLHHGDGMGVGIKGKTAKRGKKEQSGNLKKRGERCVGS